MGLHGGFICHEYSNKFHRGYNTYPFPLPKFNNNWYIQLKSVDLMIFLVFDLVWVCCRK